MSLYVLKTYIDRQVDKLAGLYSMNGGSLLLCYNLYGECSHWYLCLSIYQYTPGGGIRERLVYIG